MEYQQSIGNLPSTSPNEKTLLWSQPGQYMVDSGYTTKAPSICSTDAFEQMDVVSQPIQQDQQQCSWDYNNVQPVNEVMVSQQPDDDNALENWMNYQDSSEVAIKAIPDLIKLINDEDHVVVNQASILVFQMSKKKTTCLALIETQDCVSSLVNCLTSQMSIDTAKNVVGTFYNISMYKQGILSIISSNAIQPLVNLFSVPMESVVSFAITTLHNVLLDQADIKNLIREYGGIQKMVPLLRNHANAKFLAIVVDCLHLVSISHKESKLIILECGGPEFLVSILQNNTYSKLTLMTFKLLKVLSVCTQCKKKLVNIGAMQALAKHLTSSTAKGVQNCLITLRNLSDAATCINGLEELIEQLIKLIASSDDAVSTLAAGILSNLTCNNEANKLAVLKYNGIPILLRVIDSNILKVELAESCICTIRHVTNKYEESVKAQEQVFAYEGFQLFNNIIKMQPRNWAVLKATLGVIRNYSNAMNMQVLKKFFKIEYIIQIMYEAFNMIQQQQQSSEVNFASIIDLCSSIFIVMVKDYDNFTIVKNANCVNFFTQLVYSSNIKIQRTAACVLSELIQNVEFCGILDQQPQLHNFLQMILNNYNSDKILSDYAKIIFHHIKQFHMMKQQQQQQQQFHGQTNFY